MKVFTKDFWCEKELAFQHVHMFWAANIALALSWIGTQPWTWFVVVGVWAMSLETYQFFVNDAKDWKIWDRVRDLAFWMLGVYWYYFIYTL